MVDVNDVGRESRLIPIAVLDSTTLASDIGEFVHAVLALHSSLEPVSNRIDEVKTGWKEGKEFDGEKTKVISGGTSVYDYLHGPLCNYLGDWLKYHLKSHSRYIVRRNKNIDLAIVDSETDLARAIFEVKTSSELSGQLYSSIGQLVYYRQRYGSSNTLLFLVLPEQCVLNGFPAHVVFGALGIHVVVRKGTDFTEFQGPPLNDILKSYF